MIESNFIRLIWKEYREGWPVIAAFLVLPVIVFFPSAFFPGSYLAASLVAAVMFGVPFTSVLWASEKRRTVKQGCDILGAVLPVTPVQDWVASFLLPSLLVGICGGWMLLMYTITPAGHGSDFSILSGATICATAFMLSSFLSKSVSNVLGIIAGTLWILWAYLNLMSALTIQLVLVSIVLALAALMVLEFRKSGTRILHVFTAAILVILIGIVLQKEIVETVLQIIRPSQNNAYELSYTQFMTKDGSMVRWSGHDPSKNIDSILYENGMSREVSSDGIICGDQQIQHFPSIATPIALDDNRRVYVLSQPSRRSDISIFRWDTHIDHVNTVCKLPAECGIDNHSIISRRGTNTVEAPGMVDPTGTRLILNVHSTMGTGRDLWLIDLAAGSCRLLLANDEFAWEKATWLKDKVFLTGNQPALEVNTKDFTVKPLIQERKSR